VIPSVYHQYKEYGNKPIDQLVSSVDLDTGRITFPLIEDETSKKIVDRVIEVFGKHSAFRLSAMTHASGSPWEDYEVDEDQPSPVISIEAIRDYFTGLGREQAS